SRRNLIHAETRRRMSALSGCEQVNSGRRRRPISAWRLARASEHAPEILWYLRVLCVLCVAILPSPRLCVKKSRRATRKLLRWAMPEGHTPQRIDEERRTLILTGASRGIGHATVKRLASAGWRVITCSRHAFPENCPWAAAPEDHIQVDLADPDDTLRAIAEMRERLTDGKLHALVNNAAISPKGNRQSAAGDQERQRNAGSRLPDAERLNTLTTIPDLWRRVFEVNFFSTI